MLLWNKKKLALFLHLICFQTLAEVMQINKDHSEVFFEVPYLSISNVTGRFTQFSGNATFTEGGPPNEISVRIDSSSIETGNRLRDGHLRSGEFLKSKQYPFIIFKSQAIAAKGPQQFIASGDLSIAGVTKKQIFEFKVSELMKDTWSYQSRFVKFHTKISRKDFNLIWNKTLEGSKYLVGDEIVIRGVFQMQPAQLATPSSKHMIPDTAYIRKREKLLRGETIPEKIQSSFTIPSSPTGIKTDTPPSPKVIPEIKVSYDKDFRQSLSWRISFGILGMLGFLASIIIGLYTKKFMISRYPQKYREGGFLGLVTDSVTIVFVLLFVVALWEVGWA